jgi:hypothetical protein
VEAKGVLSFERPEPLPLGDHYAARRTIPAAKGEGVRRICLFGESAAAGYLYAPHRTPATVLQRQLDTVEEGAFEVIDLARTNERLHSLATTAERALQLEPDHWVIYTGNNWKLLETPECSPYSPSVAARQAFARVWRSGGAEAVARWAERRWQGRAREAFERLAEITRAAGVEVTLMIPEVNLRDWENRQPPPWLPGDGSRRWHKLYAQAVAELEEGQPRTALALAREMLRLHSGRDGGGCPTAHRLAARAHLALGQVDEARRAAEAEVASVAYPTLAFLGAPQACTAVQTFQREVAGRYGWKVVDLPQVFRQHLEKQGLPPLPGRELFLDYCHLSAEGMEVAIGALVPHLIENPPSVPLSSKQRKPLSPWERGGGEGTARTGAALHSAHRLLSTQPTGPLLEHWLRAAVAADPAVHDAFFELAEARTAPVVGAPAPAVLTAAQGRNLASPHRLLLQHGWRWNHLDGEVLRAILKIWRESGEGERAEAIEARLLAYHRPMLERSLDLLAPPYLWEPLERLFPEVMATEDLPGRATLRSPWPEVSFCRVVEAGEAQTLRLTVRLPAIAGEEDRRQGALTVLVEGEAVALLDVGERWSRHTVQLLPAATGGLTRLTLRWPPLPAVHGLGEVALAVALERLEGGVEAELHPIFGEVAALRLSLWQP